MPELRVSKLAGDARALETKWWHVWFEQAGHLAQRFDKHTDDPFAYNETASVSVLAAAAAMAGMLGIAEYTSTKRSAADRRKNAPGRADFWLCSRQRSWSFEFKQLSPEKRVPSRSALSKLLDQAVNDAECLAKSEADCRVGGLIVSTWWMETPLIGILEARLQEFSGQADLAWVIDPGTKHARPTYLFFTRC